ncbi:MAG: sigma-54 dependent transcriptional regulator [Spirochaetota bacterium]|nr:sigma-54 dependent transcriptional regulator [Spirochaetota bacterium]
MSKILIIDDDELVRKSYSKVLSAYKLSVVDASNSNMAISLFEKEKPDVVLLDLILPGENGIDILKEIKKIDHLVPIIIVTAFGNVPTAVEAIKLGAYDFILKPPEFDKLYVIIRRAIESLELKRQVKKLDLALETSFEMLLGKSKPIKEIISQINLIAQSEFSLILQGKTGTGKTYIANVIHNLSKRVNNPFVKVDIGAIPENLVESELFGHEKGAFTGADRKKKGFFEIANNGTIFIDELENMSPYVQSKFLTAVEEKRFYPIGSTTYVEADVRIIAATNTDITQNIADGKFREDLFYRLGEFVITIPPLSERIEDISFFAHKFLNEANIDLNKNVKTINSDALNLLKNYSWPGNVRELKTVIRKAVLFADDIITEEHIRFMKESNDNPEQKKNKSLLSFKNAVGEAEIQSIKRALSISNGNKSKAANLLDLNYKTFLRKIKEYEIDQSELSM